MVSALLFDTIVYVSILALLSIGLTLTYMTTRVPNFAHASFAIIGAYTSWTIVNTRIINTARKAILAGLQKPEVQSLIQSTTITACDYIFSILLSFLIAGLIAGLQYLVILRPLAKRGTSQIGLMIATIAVDMLIFAFINIYADYAQSKLFSTLRDLEKTAGYGIPILIKARDFNFISYDIIPGTNIQKVVIVAPLLTLTILLLLTILLYKTRFGVALRASIENPSLACVLGVNVERMYLISWIISGGIAGAAGSMLPMKFLVSPSIGQVLIVSIFAASIVGGLNALYGAVLGGFIVGVSETLGMNALFRLLGINPGYKPIIPLIVIALTLLFLPNGIAEYISGLRERKATRR